MAETSDSHGPSSSTEVASFMTNVANIMEKLADIQKKIGPLEFSKKEPGLKGALLRLFEACCPLHRNHTDDQMWEEHLKIRKLMEDENLPKTSYIRPILNSKNRVDVIDKVFEWIKNSGGDVSNVKYDTSGGLNLTATNNIEAQVPFLTIHKSNVLMSDEFVEHKAINYLVSRDPILSSMQNILLSYGLLIEFYLGDQSRFWPYLQSLPESYGTAYFYDESDMELLKGTLSFREALNSWKGVVRQYAYFHLKIIETLPTVKPDVEQALTQIDLVNRFCFDDYRWAAATVSARALLFSTASHCRNVLALIPLTELCSHSDTITNIDFDAATDSVRVSSGFDIVNGEKIGIFYGARTTAQFLIHYGFFCENNVHNFIIVRMLYDKKDDLSRIKHGLFIKIGLYEYTGLPLNCNSTEVWSGDVMAYMRIYAADDEDVSVIQSFTDEKLRAKLYDKEPLSITNEERAKETLEKILKKHIDEYKKALERDSQKETDQNIKMNTKCILQLKRSDLKQLEEFYSRFVQNSNGTQETLNTKTTT